MSGKQVDLFLDSLINAPFKDDRALMEFPFFSLQKTPRRRPLVYDDGKVKIEIRPGDRGIATIWDKDVLIYIASIINDRIERGLPVERKHCPHSRHSGLACWVGAQGLRRVEQGLGSVELPEIGVEGAQLGSCRGGAVLEVAGEEVVVEGGFVLKSELGKGEMGGGHSH